MKWILWVGLLCGCATVRTAEVDGETIEYKPKPGESDDMALMRAVRERDEAAEQQAAKERLAAQSREQARRRQIQAAWEEGWQQGDPLDYQGKHGLYKSAEAGLIAFEDKVEWLSNEFARNNYSDHAMEVWHRRMDKLKEAYIEDKGRSFAFQDDLGDPDELAWCLAQKDVDLRYDPRVLQAVAEGEQTSYAVSCTIRSDGLRQCRRITRGVVISDEPKLKCSKYSLQVVNRYRGAPFFIDRSAARASGPAPGTFGAYHGQ